MLQIKQENPHKIKVESVMIWPKCDFCDTCHPANRCPKVKWFDRTFKTRHS